MPSRFVNQCGRRGTEKSQRAAHDWMHLQLAKQKQHGGSVQRNNNQDPGLKSAFWRCAQQPEHGIEQHRPKVIVAVNERVFHRVELTGGQEFAVSTKALRDMLQNAVHQT